MSAKKYDLVLYGATSFVGKILASYLVSNYNDGDLKWAMAGRSEGKLEALRTELGDAASDIDVFIADAADEAALQVMVARTRVVVSTVGPYALYGEPLVKACAESGTDYCDLTGEAQWISRMIERYETTAKQSGARIVHCCGFDSIPSDLGNYFVQEAAHKATGEYCQRVKMRVKTMKGEFSGGTVASLMNVVKEATRDAALRKELANPYSLCPTDHGYKVRQNNVSTTQRDRDFKRWIAPFIMAAINTRVVFRSNALRDSAYGQDFRYDEAMMMGSGPVGAAMSVGITGALAGFMTAAAIPPSRWVLERFVVPKPGEGPSPEAQEKGCYDLRFFGETPSGKTFFAKVTGDRDPGYGSTAKMLGQAAICLARDIDKDACGGGFWTPSTAMGDALLQRLQDNAGLSFELLQGTAG